MYHASIGATTGALAFTGTVLDMGWLVVFAVSALFAGLALKKIIPMRKKTK